VANRKRRIVMHKPDISMWTVVSSGSDIVILSTSWTTSVHSDDFNHQPDILARLVTV
jgi:hypothetical protein